MPEATFHFPRGFLWGTATSSHQVEGNNTNNNWYAWEEQGGRILHGQKAGLACDWWGGRWKEDFDRAEEDGQTAHRLSIEWSRVQPGADRWDEDALDHYRQMVRGLRERGMTPMVTLHHFTEPLWLYEQGSWEREGIVELFAKYTEKVVEALREYVQLWVPINEPNVYMTLGYVTGEFPPGRKNINRTLPVATNMLNGHAAAYQVIHRLQPNALVGTAVQYRDFLPAKSWFAPDGWAAKILSGSFNDAFMNGLRDGKLRLANFRQNLPKVKGTHDFVGVNYYTREYVAFNPAHPDMMFTRRFFRGGAELSESGMLANEPLGFYRALEWAKSYGLPIFVTENGVEDAEDRLRPRYLAEHIHQMWRAVNSNFPVRGYFHWSLVDNFEWERGWTQRFGLWELEPVSQGRRRRSSADLYREICLENGLSSEMVRKYAASAVESIFPA